LYEQDGNADVKIEERNISMDIMKKILNIGDPISKFRFISRNESGGKNKRRTKGIRTTPVKTNGMRTKRNRTKLQKRY
jgi:hypothetical protein